MGRVRGLLGGGRGQRAVTGLVDQVLLAVANAGNGLLAVILLPREEAGGVLLSIACLYFATGVNRAFVGDVLLAHASRYDGEERRRRVEHGAATALTIGMLAAVVLGALSLLWPGDMLDHLTWAVPFLPFLLLHDTGRYAFLAGRQQSRALGIDVIWVAMQAVAVGTVILTGVVSGGALLACWGVGATAGAIAFLARTRVNPLRGRPTEWVRETRHLSGWFTATALVAQAQTQLVAVLVVGLLSKSALAGLRTIQYVVLTPVQNLVLAASGLLIPRASRLAAGGDARALARQTRLLAAGLGGCALVLLALVPLAEYVLLRIPSYRDVAPLALPTAIQAGIYLLQIPFTAALRGMHRARMLFVQYAAFTATSLVGLLVGAYQGGLLGAAWGLTTGATVGLVAMVVLYQVAIRQLTITAAATAPAAPVNATSP